MGLSGCSDRPRCPPTPPRSSALSSRDLDQCCDSVTVRWQLMPVERGASPNGGTIECMINRFGESNFLAEGKMLSVVTPRSHSVEFFSPRCSCHKLLPDPVAVSCSRKKRGDHTFSVLDPTKHLTRTALRAAPCSNPRTSRPERAPNLVRERAMADRARWAKTLRERGVGL